MRIKNITLGVCFTFVGFLLVNCVAYSQDEWPFKPGIITPHGINMNVLKNDAGQLITVTGYLRISKIQLTEVSVYHALIFLPKSLIIGNGGLSSNEGPLSTETLTWKVQKNPSDYKNIEEKSLKIKYHALNKSVSIDSEIFSISNGNVFVIRFNDSWIPTIDQLPAHLDEPAEEQSVLDFFKSILQEDNSIQQLKLS